MKKMRMLPRQFKWIGFLIMLVYLIVLAILRLLHFKISLETEPFKQISISIFFLGLFLVIYAREKIEDEFVDACRLIAFSLAFGFGMVSVIMAPIFNFKEANSREELVFTEMIFYLIMFTILRKGVLRLGK